MQPLSRADDPAFLELGGRDTRATTLPILLTGAISKAAQCAEFHRAGVQREQRVQSEVIIYLIPDADQVVRFGHHGYLNSLGNFVTDDYFLELWEHMIFGGIHVVR